MTRADEANGLVAGLIEAVARTVDGPGDLAGRREEIIKALGHLTRSDFGFWAWGRGHHPRQTISPVAIVPFGFEGEAFGRFVEGAMLPATIGPWRDRVTRALGSSQASTCSRTDLYTEPKWHADPFADCLRSLEMDEWVHSLRYSTADTWSNVFVTRRRPAAPYSEAERDLVDLAMRSIPWLHATAKEIIPQEAFRGITPRQRSILLMLLDGLTRKSVADQLRISEDTVGEHIKAIYRHFGVRSVTELAGMFLKSL